MEKMKKIKLPLTRSQREDVYVGINGKSWLIRRGTEVEVPWNVVKVLERQERMLSVAMDYEAEAARPLKELEKAE